MDSIVSVFSSLLFGSPESQIRSSVRGICKAMVASAAALESFSKKKGLAEHYYSDYAAQALMSRPGWKEIETNVFESKKGRIIQIKNDYSVADVCLLVVLSEIADHTGTQDISSDTEMIIVDEFKKMFGSDYSDKKIDQVIHDWRESSKYEDNSD
mgnify:CR=1 FL=1